MSNFEEQLKKVNKANRRKTAIDTFIPQKNDDKTRDAVEIISNNNDINDKTSININDDNKYDVSNNANENASNLDYLDKLIEGNTKKTVESQTVLTGIYLQKDLAQQLDRLAKKGGRGAKSRIVNEALRSVFKDKGLL